MPKTSAENNKKIRANEISSEQKRGALTRTLVAIPLILIFLVALIFGGWVMVGFVFILAALGIYELIKSCQKKLPIWVWILTYLVGYLLIFWPLLKGNIESFRLCQEYDVPYSFALEECYGTLSMPFSIIGIALIIYFLMAVLDKNFTFKDIAYLFVFTLLIGMGLQAVLFCRFCPFSHWYKDFIYDRRFTWCDSAFLLFTIVAVTCLTDAFAYFGGMLFGKHKMITRVSPKKTWEGFFIGWAFGAAAAIGLMFGLLSVPHAGYETMPSLDIEAWWRIVILGILLPLLGTLGDLAFSLIKREQGIKDYSNLLPGHGGMLDRMDSPIFVCLGTAIILSLFSSGWVF